MDKESELPKDLINGLEDPENFNKICEIAEIFKIAGKYSEGINKLDAIFEKVLSGKLAPHNTTEEIEKEFSFGKELSQDIANEMENQIFSNYKNSLEKLYSKKEPIMGGGEEISSEEKKISRLAKIGELAKKESSLEKPKEKNILEEEILKEIQKSEETIESSEIKTNKQKEEEGEIDNVLYKLEEELKKEKQKRDDLNKLFKKEETPQ